MANDSESERIRRGETVFSGGHAFQRCQYCGDVVNLNKFLFGSLHVCISPDEREQCDREQRYWY